MGGKGILMSSLKELWVEETPTQMIFEGFHITLVHGTFARKAKWIKPTSVFATALTSELESPTISDEFRWSGWNSHKARLNASKKLAIKIKENSEEHPHYMHVVIAHSHGGNVFLNALHNLDEVPSNLRFIRLGTPFKNCEIRDLSYGVKLIGNWLKVAYYILNFGFLFLLFGLGYDIYEGKAIDWRAVGVATVYGIVLIACQKIGKYYEDYYENETKTRELYGILNRPWRIKCAAFLIHRDEARLLLLFSKLISGLSFDLREQFIKPYDWFNRHGIKLIALIVVVALATGFLEGLIGFPGEYIYMTVAIGLSSLFLFLGSVVGLLFIVGIIITFVSRSHFLSLGWDSVGSLSKLKFSIKKTPGNAKNCELFEYNSSILNSKNRLDDISNNPIARLVSNLIYRFSFRHSRIYTNKTVMQDIAKWLHQSKKV